jgi:hypothetical protein
MNALCLTFLRKIFRFSKLQFSVFVLALEQLFRQSETKIPCTMRARNFCLNRYSVKIHVPDHVKYYTDDKKSQSCYKNTIAIAFFQLSQLSFAVLTVKFVVLSAHGHECLNNVPQNESYSDESSLAADKQQAGEHRQHNAGDEESVSKYLNVNRYTVDKKAFYPEHDQRNQRGNAKTNYIFD